MRSTNYLQDLPAIIIDFKVELESSCTISELVMRNQYPVVTSCPNQDGRIVVDISVNVNGEDDIEPHSF